MANAATDLVNGIEIMIPLEGLVDSDAEKERLKKEIENLETYIKSLSLKLNNQKFIENAPRDIVEGEKAKLTEAETKISKLKEQMDIL